MSVTDSSTGEQVSQQFGYTQPLFPKNDLHEYIIDAIQRSVLSLDTLRKRGNIYFEQNEESAPNVLRFDYDVVLDGRDFARPVNYVLVQIRPEKAAVSPRKRPFIVFDPRAGHGPGIGGMKDDSEIGSALDAGHPCYFVGFLPSPMPGQTIEDVCKAEAAFITAVAARHPDAEGKPCLIGNCQAGWQIMLTAAIRPDLAGPIILAGSPLSYWEGVHGKSPMRYTGGLLGGSWLATLASDLGCDIFDGALLVQNFENLNPANTYWKKDYNLYSKIDTEAQRFLDFEKWWGHPILLNGEEMQFIVDELFVGNKLAAGRILTSDGLRVDLRNIRSPIVVFCSQGDNITPPQQALGWILDLYATDEEIIASGQTILYSLHPKIGHLGIFVSGSVAAKQHEEFAQNIDFIDALPPGLYEATFQAKDAESPHADLLPTNFVMTFQRRSLTDIRALGGNDEEDDRRFAAVARLSEINQGLYRTLVRPAVRAASTPNMAEWMRTLNPLRLRFALFSDRNPFLAGLAGTAETVRDNRAPVSTDNVFLAAQNAVSDLIVHAFDSVRDWRDQWVENFFLQFYGSPVVQASLGLASDHAESGRPVGREVARQAALAQQIAALRETFTQGGEREAIIRALIYLLEGEFSVDERSFALLRQLRAHYPPIAAISLNEFKRTVRHQFLLIRLDAKQAVATLPELLGKSKAPPPAFLELLRQVVTAGDGITPEARRRLASLEKLLDGGKAGNPRPRHPQAVVQDAPQ